ncbi:FkbM family methyltransferase [Mesorhizobium sp. M0923]|uniref:FkbM family methyltransferase n=1 Tax=Mesorhizobium sp. M0923 TaxID=2957028 RepID=UPI00333A11C7
MTGKMQLINEGYTSAWLKWHLFRKFRRRRGDLYQGALLRLRHLLATLPRKSLVIDCGANVGKVTRYFVEHGMKVIAFEPDPVARSRLLVEFSAHPDVLIEAKAVGCEDGVMPFYQLPDLKSGGIEQTESSSIVQRNVHAAEPIGRVDVIDIAAYIQALSEPVRILKLDIEGSEADVLERLIESEVYRTIDLILVETHDRFSDSLAFRLQAIRKKIVNHRIRNINLDWR